jgi:hypothetical protein
MNDPVGLADDVLIDSTQCEAVVRKTMVHQKCHALGGIDVMRLVQPLCVRFFVVVFIPQFIS